MSTVSKGARIEVRAVHVAEGLGYEQVARSHRVKYGPVDMARGSIDRILKKPGERTLWMQVTTMKANLSEKRRKIRECPFFDEQFDEVQIWAWAEPAPGKKGGYYILRMEEDYKLNRDNYIEMGDDEWPWNVPKPRQATL